MKIDVNTIMNSIKLVGINGRYTHSCLALFYLRNELTKYCPDFKTEILQLTINDNYFESLLRLSSGNPSYIFISAAIWNSELVEKYTRDLAICLPDCRLVIGGPQAAVLHEKLATTNYSILLGAIEAVGEQFYRDLEGFCLQIKYEANFFKKHDRGFDYPYLDSDFDTHLANRHIYYESSRGCLFGCSYCLSSVEKGVYHKPLEMVLKELRDILTHQPKIVRFIDRTFNDLPQRALAIWQFLLDEGGDTLFHFEMAPDRFTEEMFDFLRQVEPGKFQFEIGIQSTNIATLEAVNRPVDPAVVHNTVQKLSGMGTIHLHVDLILGLPYETGRTFAKSFTDVFFMGANYIQMGLLKILPETPLCYSALEFEYKHSLIPPYSVLESRWMNFVTIQDLYWFSECVEKFMNNRYFVLLWDYFRRTNEDIYAFFRCLLSLCQESQFFAYAATQELMSQKLIAMLANRDDGDIVKELLRIDWLRCNHRFFPACLVPGDGYEQPQDTKNSLVETLPEELEGVFTRKTRNRFFRKTYFLRISKQAGAEIGIDEGVEQPVLCFLSDRENALHSYSKMLVL
ncbi:MAG: Mg-protoporphyrin IX monomethyl ester oxidative cyclase [Desulfotalea sp.]|nr:MAG: Mg-protoporphyrin IX monomethyl ester oxidative cyclase [Desulfotalea sp.]